MSSLFEQCPDLQTFIKKHPHIMRYLNENNFGINSVIRHDMLPVAPGNRVVIRESVFKEMQRIAKLTKENDSEYGFVLVGNEDKNKPNSIKIDKFFESNTNVQRREYHADASTLKVLDLVNKNRNLGNTVIIGHTHPAVGRYYSNFSLGDFKSIINTTLNNEPYRTGKVNLAECMLTADEILRIACWDPRYKSFYTFTNIFIELEQNKRIVPLESYVKDQSFPGNQGGRE